MTTPNLMKQPFMPRYAAMILVMGLALLSGCASVLTDYDPQANIRNYHSYLLEYAGQRGDDIAFNNPLNEKRLVAAVERNLVAKGLQPVAEGATPDCIVRLSSGSRQVLENDSGPVRVGVGFGWYHHGVGSSFGLSNDVYASDEHRISIDLLDAKNNSPIWHASVNENINRLSGASAETHINDVVNQIFQKFP